jgi:hypothetical protein
MDAELDVDLFPILLLYPFLILHLFKEIRHELLKFAESASLLRLVINFADEIVDHEHDEIIVVTTLSIFKDDFAVGEVIVREGFYVINFPHSLFHFLVDEVGVCQWIFGCQVC